MFHFTIDFCMGLTTLCSAIALPVMVILQCMAWYQMILPGALLSLS